MALFDWLRSAPAGRSQTSADTDTVRRIIGELDRMDADQARHVAAFAYVLSRVAGADHHISEVETARMLEIVRSIGNLPEAQAVVVVEIAKKQNLLFGGTENFLVTREFREIASDAQRNELLDCLFAVAAADDAITGEEEAQLWQIASELGFTHEQYVQVRARFADKRTVLRHPISEA
jgi:uncharacterized tellurite resistance protein B-like protein